LACDGWDRRVQLQITGLASGYDGREIVHEANVTVRRGEAVLIIGRNGAGKSTLLKAIMGFIPCYRGEVTLEDRPIQGWEVESISRIGLAYVPQDGAVFTSLTVANNLRMGGYQLASSAASAAFEQVLEMLPPLRPRLSRRAGTLSGGERRMLAVAMALVREPKVMLLDEPSAGLSTAAAERVFELITDIRKSLGISVVLVEQNVQQALAIADTAVVMRQGVTTPPQLARDIRERGVISDIL
jgi:branched-chain amino acid transport system ATP-binding protein